MASPYIFKACIAHIAVNHNRWFLIHNPADRLIDRLRRGHIGISQAEIIYIFCSIYGCQPFSLLKHSPDCGVIIYKRLHLF